MEARHLHKIEEMSNRYCYECLIIKSKSADHCKHCNQCVNYRHKHSKIFGRCIGNENVKTYFFHLLLSMLFITLFILISTFGYSSEFQTTKTSL
jgi:hypothetical protein